MARRSAAFVLTIVVVLAFLTGALLLTVVDPLAQALFDSALFTSTTQDGANLLAWSQDMWMFVPAAMLIMLLVVVWVETRQPA